jgi:hypothetical protein
MLKDKWQGSTWSAQADASLTRKNTGTRRRRHQASPSRRPMLHELCCMRLWLCFICCVLWMSVKDGRSWQIFLMIYISFYSWLFDLWPECLKERNGKISIFSCCLLLWSGRIEECWFRAKVVLHDRSCMMRAKLLLGKNCPGRWHTRVSTRSLTEYNSNNVIPSSRSPWTKWPILQCTYNRTIFQETAREWFTREIYYYSLSKK